MKKMMLFVLFITSLLQAQTEETSSKIKVYTPTSSSAASAANSYRWTVKTDLFSFASGEFPIIGEYRFAKSLSAEASAGVTYGFYENFGLSGKDEYDGEGYTFESKPAMGTAFRAGIKYYPSSDYDAIEGWAFGLQVFARTNNREYKTDSFSDLNPIGEKDSRSKTGIALTISKQVYSDSNIAFEYMLGIGFASVKHDFLTYNNIYNSDNSSSTEVLIPVSIKETVPNFQFGCRIGFGN